MPKLPPLECLRYFEVAARHQSFVRAAKEIGVTPAAVAYRVKVLEEHLGHTLFKRHRRSVKLNTRGQACLRDVQRVLAEIGEIAERYGSGRSVRRLSLAAVESVADRWLMPRLSGFKALEPDIVIEIETDLMGTDPQRHDVDLWITYHSGENRAPSGPEMHYETLFEETMFPVCSPALLEARSRPARAAELRRWPLLYHSGMAVGLAALVRRPRDGVAESVPRLRVQTLQHAGASGPGWHGRSHRSPDDHRAGVAAGDAGAAPGPAHRATEQLLSGFERHGKVSTGGAGLSRLDPQGGRRTASGADGS